MVDCVKLVSQAMDGATDAELEQIFNRVDGLIKDSTGMKTGEVMEKLNKSIVDDSIAKKIEARNTALNAQAYLNAKQFVGTLESKELGMEALLVGINGREFGGRRSVAGMQDMMMDSYLAGFTADMEALGKGAMDLFATGSLDDDVARALWAKTTDTEIDVDVNAKKIADVIHTWQEISRIDANKAGAWIRKLPGYITRQSHDMDKIREAGFQAWREVVEPRLDEATFDGVKDREDFLESVWNGLQSGVHLGDGTIPGLKGFSNVGKAMSHERVLHFKDADSWLYYDKRFGRGSIREAVLGSLISSSRKTGLMKILGPNAEMNYERMVDDFRKELRPDNEALKSFDSARKGRLDNYMKMVTGQTNIPGNTLGASIFQVARSLTSIRMLGKAVLSSIADVPIGASELRHNGMNFFQRQGTALSSMIGAIGDAGRSIANRQLTVKTHAHRRLLAELGISLDATTGMFTSRFDLAADSLPGRSTRSLQTFFRWNGLTLWTDSMRSGNVIGMASHVGSLANKTHEKLPVLLKNTLKQYGIDKAEWELLRSAGTKSFEGVDGKYLTPDAAFDIDEKLLSAHLESIGVKPTKYQINKFRDDLYDSFKMYYVDRSKYAVLEPDAKTKATLLRDTQPGTVTGETLRSIAQFKSFPATIIQKVWGRELRSNLSTMGAIGGMAEVMIMSTLFGYVAMAAKDLVANKTPRDPTDPKTWTAAWLQGGAAGIYGDFLFGKGSENRYGVSFVGTAAGPIVSQVEEIWKIYAAAKDGDGKAFDKGFRMLYQNAPGVVSMAYPPAAALNSIYAKGVLDHLIYYKVIEFLSPGYKRRMERRLKRENDQELLIK